MKILDEQQQLLLDNNMLKKQVIGLTVGMVSQQSKINELVARVNELVTALNLLKSSDLNSYSVYEPPRLLLPYTPEDFA